MVLQKFNFTVVIYSRTEPPPLTHTLYLNIIRLPESERRSNNNRLRENNP